MDMTTTEDAQTAARSRMTPAVGGASGVAGSRGSLTAGRGQRTAAFDGCHYACAPADGFRCDLRGERRPEPRLASFDGFCYGCGMSDDLNYALRPVDGLDGERGAGTDGLNYALRLTDDLAPRLAAADVRGDACASSPVLTGAAWGGSFAIPPPPPARAGLLAVSLALHCFRLFSSRLSSGRGSLYKLNARRSFVWH
jgi:hypothetical protein